MFPSRALGSLKSIFPPIHQPLPLNHRESLKLLNALTQSFRTHLDKEHGSAVERGPVDLPPSPTLNYLPERPTDRHMRDILSNPLFRDSSANDPLTQSSASPGTSLDPREVFERAVSKGLMTIPRAHGFLLRVTDEVVPSTTISVSQGMKQSGAGLMVLQWLRASGQERSLCFLTNKKFTTILVRFMVAEGLDELAWGWLRRLLELPAAHNEEPTKSATAKLLNALALAKPEALVLDDAFSVVLRGAKLIQARSAPPQPVRMAWTNVARQTTGASWRCKAPGVELFEPFLAVGQRLSGHMLETAHLDLYHPTSPSSDRALAYLLNDTIWKEKLPLAVHKWNQSGAKELPLFVKLLNLLSIDTVRHLTKAGEYEQAQKILDKITMSLTELKLDLPNLGYLHPHRDLDYGLGKL